MEIERVEVTLKQCKSMTDQLKSLGASIVTEKLEDQIVKKAQNKKGKTLFKAIVYSNESVLVSYAKGLFDKI
jgi:Leu/Phe-tRNA-protein transferase